MAKTINVQILNDGYRDATIKIDGYVNAEDYSAYVVLDPATLSQIDAQGSLATRVRVLRINYDIEDALEVDLTWDGATPASLWRATGRGDMKGRNFGGIVDNATTPNGKITLTTLGGATATTNLSFSIILELVKSN